MVDMARAEAALQQSALAQLHSQQQSGRQAELEIEPRADPESEPEAEPEPLYAAALVLLRDCVPGHCKGVSARTDWWRLVENQATDHNFLNKYMSDAVAAAEGRRRGDNYAALSTRCARDDGELLTEADVRPCRCSPCSTQQYNGKQ